MDDPNRTSRTLIGRLGDLSDTQAWGEFDARYRPLLRAWARRRGLTETDNQDLTQDVMLRVAVAMRAAKYDPARPFRKWLGAVFHNALCDYMRRQPDEGGAKGGSTNTADHQHLADDMVNFLNELMVRDQWLEACARVQARTPPAEWAVFDAVVIQGRSGVEVAREMVKSPAWVSITRQKVEAEVRTEYRRLDGDT